MLQMRKTRPLCTIMPKLKNGYFLSHIQIKDEADLDPDPNPKTEKKREATDTEVKAVNPLTPRKKVTYNFTLFR